ncbi:hypothetical protein RB608_09510 [Nocardioides sp. LHD-245]|uniref:hypothetical protein n=1 Tax=Nocardioides sp. LHD-245 TaxID=3051387 RepID=UPI0027E17BB9|nr:hypothetical protein [Nocardioides sp. LHD-245]
MRPFPIIPIIPSLLARVAAWLRPAATHRESRPTPRAPAPVVVPAPRSRPAPRSLAVIRSARLRTTDGDRLFTVLATCRAGRRRFVLTSSGDCSQSSRAALGLDAFERLLADAERYDERVVLLVRDARLLAALRESAAAFPRIDLVASPGVDPLGRLDAAARERLHAQAAPAAAAPVSTRPVSPLRVGTDASKSRRRGVGLGVATERGEVTARFVGQTTDILHGELQAIGLALDSYPGRPLLIESDSLNAVRYLTERSRPSNPSTPRPSPRSWRACGRRRRGSCGSAGTTAMSSTRPPTAPPGPRGASTSSASGPTGWTG